MAAYSGDGVLFGVRAAGNKLHTTARLGRDEALSFARAIVEELSDDNLFRDPVGPPLARELLERASGDPLGLGQADATTRSALASVKGLSGTPEETA